jgi:hypothetical protein
MGRHSKLIQQARNLAAARGHKLGEFLLTRIETGSPPIATRGCMTTICVYCGSSAAVDSSPPAGVSEIWGEALENDCPGKTLADWQDPDKETEAMPPDDDLLTSLRAKLDPRRFPNMSPKFAAVVGCLLQMQVTEPRLVEVAVTSDGFLLGRHEGDIGCNEFLGTRTWLLENWEKLSSLPEVGLTGDEYQAARELVAHLEKV